MSALKAEFTRDVFVTATCARKSSRAFDLMLATSLTRVCDSSMRSSRSCTLWGHVNNRWLRPNGAGVAV